MHAPAGGGYRPTPAGRLRYLLGGRLTGQLDWVRQDLTGPGWRWRICRRSFYQVLPVAIGASLLPLPGTSLHLLMALLVLGSWGMTVPPLAEQLRNRRLRQHQLPVPAEQGPDRTYG